MNILVHAFDDESIVLEWLQRLLSPDKFNLKVFKDPKQFIAAFTENVDLIITDIRAPGYHIDDALDNFKKIRPRGLYIIVISAHFDNDINQRLFELGVDRIVPKGSDNQDWVDTLTRYLNELFPSIHERTLLSQ